MLGEVGEVLGIERGQRQVVHEAARGDPGVVMWRGAPAPLSAGLELALDDGNRLVVLEHTCVLTPPGQVGGSPWTPLTEGLPFGEFT